MNDKKVENNDTSETKKQEPGRFSRTALLIGEEGVARLSRAHVAVFGVGGVGSFAVEALARAGIGALTLVDHDTVDITNLNRQLHALESTVGEQKTKLMAGRIREINPAAEVETIEDFFLPEKEDDFFRVHYDYVVDAIDTVKGKIGLVLAAKRRGIPIISSMGAANKLDPTRFEVADIAETSVDPLARVMRKKLKEMNVHGVKVVYSREEPKKPLVSSAMAPAPGKNSVPASISFVPSVCGLIIAGEVVRDLLGISR